MGNFRRTATSTSALALCPARLSAAAIIAAWAFGCGIPLHPTASADREVSKIIDEYDRRTLADRATWVKRPAAAPGPTSAPAASVPTGEAGANEPPRQLDLETCLSLAFSSSRDFKTARETLYRAGLGYSLARYTFGPILDSTIRYLWNYNEGTPNTHTLDLPIGVRQILPLGGTASVAAGANGVRTRAGTAAGDEDFRWNTDYQINLEQPLLRGAGYEVSHEALTAAERNLIYAVREFELFRQDFSIRIAQAYFELVSRRKRLSNDEQNYKDAVYDRKRAEALRALDRNKPDDVFQARRREIEAENALVAARTSYRLQLDDLKILLALPPTEQIELADEEPPFEEVRIESQSAIEVALHNRLDLHTQRDRLEDARRQLRNSRNDLLPDLNVTAAYGVGSLGAPTTDATPNQRDAAAGITLRLPLDKLAERNSYRNARISLDQSVRTLEQRQHEVERDVRNALRELTQFEQQISLQQDQIASERRAVAVMQIRVEAGEAQQRDLTEARQSLNNAQNRLIDFKVQHFVARLRLWRELGILFVDAGGRWQT